MNKKIGILQRLVQEQALEKQAQEMIDQQQGQGGEQFAENIFDQILDSISLEELES